MAARRSYASDRRQSGGYRSMQYGSRQAYMYGNIVTKPEYEPRRRKSSAKPKKESKQTGAEEQKSCTAYECSLCDFSRSCSNCCAVIVRYILYAYSRN